MPHQQTPPSSASVHKFDERVYAKQSGMKLRVCAHWLPEGSVLVEGVDVDRWSVAQLKQWLRSQVPGAPPEGQQRLVGRRCGPLIDDTKWLSSFGLVEDDCLVLLAAVHAERLPPAPAHSPAANSIKAAIREEARKRGTEHLLRDADEGGRPRNLLGPSFQIDLRDLGLPLVSLLEELETQRPRNRFAPVNPAPGGARGPGAGPTHVGAPPRLDELIARTAGVAIAARAEDELRRVRLQFHPPSTAGEGSATPGQLGVPPGNLGSMLGMGMAGIEEGEDDDDEDEERSLRGSEGDGGEAGPEMVEALNQLARVFGLSPDAAAAAQGSSPAPGNAAAGFDSRAFLAARFPPGAAAGHTGGALPGGAGGSGAGTTLPGGVPGGGAASATGSLADWLPPRGAGGNQPAGPQGLLAQLRANAHLSPGPGIPTAVVGGLNPAMFGGMVGLGFGRPGGTAVVDEGSPAAGGGELRAPEPPADLVAQLTAMGFEEPVVRKALALARNQAEPALDWLLMHAEDPGAADPPTQEELRRVYGAPVQSRVTTEQAITQLTEMGFPREEVTAAVHRFRNVELALGYLMGGGVEAPRGSSMAAGGPRGAHQAGGGGGGGSGTEGPQGVGAAGAAGAAGPALLSAATAAAGGSQGIGASGAASSSAATTSAGGGAAAPSSGPLAPMSHTSAAEHAAGGPMSGARYRDVLRQQGVGLTSDEEGDEEDTDDDDEEDSEEEGVGAIAPGVGQQRPTPQPGMRQQPGGGGGGGAWVAAGQGRQGGPMSNTRSSTDYMIDLLRSQLRDSNATAAGANSMRGGAAGQAGLAARQQQGAVNGSAGAAAFGQTQGRGQPGQSQTLDQVEDAELAALQGEAAAAAQSVQQLTQLLVQMMQQGQQQQHQQQL